MIDAVVDPMVRDVRLTRVRGLYAVTPDLDDTALLVSLVEAALRGGAKLVQYRNKTASAPLRIAQAGSLATCCASFGRPLVVNDHVDLALAIDGAGLHVGRDDATGATPLRRLRDTLGPDRLFGVSCYRSVELAREAVEAGADYVAFGSMFPSTTKTAAPPASPTLFGQAKVLGVPMVGIGGIDRTNLASLIDAGCDAAAVIADLFASHDPSVVESRARQLSSAFEHPSMT